MPLKDREERLSYARSYNPKWYQRNKEHRLATGRAWYEKNKETYLAQRRAKREKNPAQHLLDGARTRARKLGLACTITVDDIQIPEKCPLFGIPLVVAKGKAKYNSPTLDRLDPKKGYIPGNISVISQRANRMKGDATSAELRRIADWMDHACP